MSVNVKELFREVTRPGGGGSYMNRTEVLVKLFERTPKRYQDSILVFHSYEVPNLK